MKSPRVRIPLVVVLALVFHLTLFHEIRVAGAQPDGMLLIAIAAGIVGGSESGAIVGFLAGAAADLFLLAPFGLSSLAYCLVGFGVGSVQSAILRSTWWIPVVTTVGATASAVVLYALLGTMVGQASMVEPRLLVTAVLVGLLNAPFSLVAIRVLGWSLRGDPERSFARAA